MEHAAISLSRDLDLPRVIVWDALVDADLVSGWLADAEIEPIAGGRYNLVWVHRQGFEPTFGRITQLQHPERLAIDTSNTGRLEFRLESMDGGFRDTWTRLTVTVVDDVDDAQAVARLTADWLCNLEQLEELLHGRPVDWSNWERDRRDQLAQHLQTAANSRA